MAIRLWVSASRAGRPTATRPSRRAAATRSRSRGSRDSSYPARGVRASSGPAYRAIACQPGALSGSPAAARPTASTSVPARFATSAICCSRCSRRVASVACSSAFFRSVMSWIAPAQPGRSPAGRALDHPEAPDPTQLAARQHPAGGPRELLAVLDRGGDHLTDLVVGRPGGGWRRSPPRTPCTSWGRGRGSGRARRTSSPPAPAGRSPSCRAGRPPGRGRAAARAAAGSRPAPGGRWRRHPVQPADRPAVVVVHGTVAGQRPHDAAVGPAEGVSRFSSGSPVSASCRIRRASSTRPSSPRRKRCRVRRGPRPGAPPAPPCGRSRRRSGPRGRRATVRRCSPRPFAGTGRGPCMHASSAPFSTPTERRGRVPLGMTGWAGARPPAEPATQYHPTLVRWLTWVAVDQAARWCSWARRCGSSCTATPRAGRRGARSR